jgi:DNA polymerase (family 10)
LTDLEQLVRSHMLRTVPGFAGSEERLLKAITASRQQPPIKKREEAP